MANPQKENGYTPIANELLEALGRHRFAGSEVRVLLAVLRYTYGFNRKTADLSLSFLARATGMRRERVVDAVRILGRKNVLLRQKSRCAFNKNWEQWVGRKSVPRTEKRPTPGRKSVLEVGRKSVPKKDNDKENIVKKTSFLTGDAGSVADDGDELNINSLIGLFEPINPSWRRLYPNKSQRASLHRLLKQHGEDALRRLIGILPQVIGKPYAPVITTPVQLEDKMGSLAVFIQKSNQPHRGTIQSL